MILPSHTSPPALDAGLFPRAMSPEPPSGKSLRAMAIQEAAQPMKRRPRKSDRFPAKAMGLLLALISLPGSAAFNPFSATRGKTGVQDRKAFAN